MLLDSKLLSLFRICENVGSTDVIISRLLAARKRDSEGITKQYPDKIPVSIKFILTVYKMT
jgi:hypothetical protein